MKAAVIGGTGYTGREITSLLINHPHVELCAVTASSTLIGQKIQDVFPRLAGRIDLTIVDAADPSIQAADVIYFSLPHKVSMGIIEQYANSGKKLIDLSADYRFDDLALYETWYGVKHVNPELNKKFLYGLPEINRNDIVKAQFVANPGCFPTGIILGLAPALKNGLIKTSGIVVDSKTGVSGAGRKPTVGIIFPEVSENVRPYKVAAHQHAPEIDQELGRIAGHPIKILFVPHLIPVSRGILSTIYCDLAKDITTDEVVAMYRTMYQGRPFVRVRAAGQYPELQDVAHTNYCDIGLKVDTAQKKLIIVAAIDNLLKGAAGQAVQNMNIMCGWDEALGF